MSTYSWSYKIASHLQPPVRKIADEADSNDTVSPKTETKAQTVHIPNLKDSQAEKPKRLNWKAKLYIGNLNKKTNEASLAYYFSVFGDIADVKLIRDHNTKESRGFAFITFEKIESAEKAKTWCSYNYPSLDDNSITVANAERKVPKIKPVAFGPPRDPSQTLFWEFKWNNEPDSEVYGPYETSLMLAWKNQGYFDGGCWVRQMLHTSSCRVEGNENEERICETTLSKQQTLAETKGSEEVCEPTPSKKLKLVIDYSDSEEEEETCEGGRLKERVVENNSEVAIKKSLVEIEESGMEEKNTQLIKLNEHEKHQVYEREERLVKKKSNETIEESVAEIRESEMDEKNTQLRTQKEHELGYEERLVNKKSEETIEESVAEIEESKTEENNTQLEKQKEHEQEQLNEREEERLHETKSEETIGKSVAEIKETAMQMGENTQEEKQCEKEQLNGSEEKREGGERTEEANEQETEKDNDKEGMSSDEEYLEDTTTEDMATEFMPISDIDFNFFP